MATCAPWSPTASSATCAAYRLWAACVCACICARGWMGCRLLLLVNFTAADGMPVWQSTWRSSRPFHRPASLPCLSALCLAMPHQAPQFKQTLEAVVRSGGSTPKLAALVQVLRQHFTVGVWCRCVGVLLSRCGRREMASAALSLCAATEAGAGEGRKVGCPPWAATGLQVYPTIRLAP